MISAKFNVFGVSDWPESHGEEFAIFLNKTFENEAAAHAAYDADLKVIVRPIT